MPGSRAPCPSCGRPLSAAARFCGGCGAAADGSGDRVDALLKQDLDSRRRLQCLFTVYGGVFAVLILATLATRSELADRVAVEVFLPLGFAAVGATAVRAFGVVAWRATVPLRVTGRGTAEGLLGGLAIWVVGSAYVALLRRLSGSAGGEGEASSALLLDLFTMAVLPAVLEEWLCRGVLWGSLDGAVAPRPLLLLTALLFACLHGLNGAFLFELPHRFAAGLVLGWLRLRSGSLAPCILAHFANNSIAVLAG